MHRRLHDFLTRLDATATVGGSWAETLAFLQSLGFDLAMYAYIVPPRSGKPDVSVVAMNNFPDWFNRRYEDELYAPHDTAAMHCWDHLAPIRMGIEWEPADQPPMERRITNEVADFGYRSAIVYPLRSPGQHTFAGISVANAMKRDRFERFLPERRLVVHAAVVHAHIRIQMQLAAEEAADVRLTPRERECLLWTGQGLTSGEIAERLGISSKAVDFHILNAMHRLGAATRAQAVARAMKAGAIKP